MEVFILCAALIAAIGILAYNRASLTMFTVVIAAVLAIGSAFDATGTAAWVVFLLLALLVAV